MKKSFIAIIITMIISGIAIFGASYAVEKKEKDSFGKGGLYFAPANSYYSFSQEKTNPMITLDCFEIKKGNYTRFLNYKKMTIIDDSGKEYEVLDASIKYVFADHYLSRMKMQLVLPLKDFSKYYTYKLTKIKLENDKEIVYKNIGTVKIQRIATEKSISTVSLAGQTMGAKTLSTFQLQVANNGVKPITINELYLDINLEFVVRYMDKSNNIADFGGNVVVQNGSYIIFMVEFKATEYEKNFPYTFIQASVGFIESEKNCAITMNIESEYIGAMDRAETKEYLAKRALI